ncbi:ATP-dependent helicase/deoxyribonuclease subunit B domain protein [Streptococcus mutans]|nr:ATP-dependent helicase/deoxyribonuclease subunit B domain protein [Streptococcus mutans]
MQEPKTDLANMKSIEKIPETVHKNLSYKGLFLEDEKAHLANGKYHLHDAVYSQKEVDLLLDYNKDSIAVPQSKSEKETFSLTPTVRMANLFRENS